MIILTILAVASSLGLLFYEEKIGASKETVYHKKTGNINQVTTTVNPLAASPSVTKAPTGTKKNRSGTNSSNTATNSSSSSSSAASYYIVALGDSLTNANNLSPQLTGDHKEYSFSTGSAIESVYLALKNNYGENLNPVNLAVSGAKTTDVLAGQLPQVSGYNPKYITLLIGGNDYLSYTPTSQFESNLRSIVNQIKASGRMIVVSTLPNFIAMRSEANPACTPLTPEIEALATSFLQAYNSSITAAANENGLLLVNLYPIMGPEHLSTADCIHFNIAGEQKAAQKFVEAIK